MSDFISSIRLCVLSLGICSAVYPGVMLAFASLAAPETRQGSLVRDEDGAIRGSRLLAQNFTRPEYFWPRPSAVDYNASATGGSNLSPTNPAIAERAKGIIERSRLKEGERIPADLVLASGSGMDPHITFEAARFQIPRVAIARGLTEDEVRDLVDQHADSKALELLGGESIVNVLELNLALDGFQKAAN